MNLPVEFSGRAADIFYLTSCIFDAGIKRAKTVPPRAKFSITGVRTLSPSSSLRAGKV